MLILREFTEKKMWFLEGFTEKHYMGGKCLEREGLNSLQV